MEKEDKELETQEPSSQPIDIPKRERKAKNKKIKYVYESDSSSEEEVVVVRKKKSGRAKKTQENTEEHKDTTDTAPVNNEPSTRQLTPQEIQRQQYLARVSQMPQYRTNLFGGF